MGGSWEMTCCTVVSGFPQDSCQVRVPNALSGQATMANSRGASADAVIASGLLTCFARDDEAAAVLALGSRALPIGGLLLLKDTLHRGAGDKLHMTGGYAGCYRVLDSYHQLIREAGFRLIADRWIDVSGETGSYMAMAEKVDS